jgi:hypothetical protein
MEQYSISLSEFYQFVGSRSQLATTVGNMTSGGLRGTSLLTKTNLGAVQILSNHLYPAIGYIAC